MVRLSAWNTTLLIKEICSRKCYLRRYSVLLRCQNVPQRCKPFLSIHTTAVNSLFWESDRKGGYGKKDNTPTIDHIRNGFKELGSEIRLWTQEVKEKFECDPLVFPSPGETDLVWLFNSPEVLDNFVTTSDSDHNQGFSKCSFEMSTAGRALFHGNLDVRVPKDGKIKKAGYCAIRSKRIRKSFKRESVYDWTMYNTLVLKVRGDGRSYLINLSTEGPFDITWNDVYHYVLYTRGGPYWQIAKIPFSKFVFGSKGSLQDRQCAIPLNRVTHFGISCGDKINGNFQLEIEYVGVYAERRSPHAYTAPLPSFLTRMLW